MSASVEYDRLKHTKMRTANRFSRKYLKYYSVCFRSPEAVALKDKIAQFAADIRKAKEEKQAKVHQNAPNS